MLQGQSKADYGWNGQMLPWLRTIGTSGCDEAIAAADACLLGNLMRAVINSGYPRMGESRWGSSLAAATVDIR